MEKPNLPFWFYAGRAAAPIDGPVYVLTADGKIVGGAGPAVLAPRTKFFASAQATSHLVSRGQVKRIADPKMPEKKEGSEPAAAPTKSSEAVAPSAPSGGRSEPETRDAVIVSGSGAGEAGASSAPEEKERSSGGSRRSRRS